MPPPPRSRSRRCRSWASSSRCSERPSAASRRAPDIASRRMLRAALDWIRGGNDATILAETAARTQALPLRTILIAAGLPVAILFLGVLIRISMHPARDIDEREFMNVGRHILETGLPLQTTFK